MISTLSFILTLFSIISASPEIALYWGQNSAGDEQSLASYCQNSPGDIYIISFINGFGNGGPISMNIHGYDNYISGTSLLDASTLGTQIQTCQKLGKKVFISLGGASGSYGLTSDSEAESVATDLWNYFGGGSSSTRPFGSGVKVDGFDFDIENQLDAAEYVTLANKLNELFATDTSKSYYLSAAPQCPFPDASVGKAVAGAHFDYLFIQFYNNYCSLIGSNFNLDTWQTFAASSPNPSVKLMVGLPGSSSAAGSGYATIDQVKAQYSSMSSAANFGGFMLWDASQGNSNIINGESYVELLETLLGGESSSSSSSSETTSPSSSSSSSSTPAAYTPETSSSTSQWQAAQTTSSSTQEAWGAASSTSTSSTYYSSPEAAAANSATATSAAYTSAETSQGAPQVTSAPYEEKAASTGAQIGNAYTENYNYQTSAAAAAVTSAAVAAQSTPYSNTTVTYTTVTGFVTLTVSKTVSTTPYAGGPATPAASQETIVHSWSSVVPVESAGSASSIEYAKAVSSVSASIAAEATPTSNSNNAGNAAPAENQAAAAAAPAANSPNGTWYNWNYKATPPAAAAGVVTVSTTAAGAAGGAAAASAATATPVAASPVAVTYSGQNGATSVVYNNNAQQNSDSSTTTVYMTSTVYQRITPTSTIYNKSTVVSIPSGSLSSSAQWSSSYNGTSSAVTTTSGAYTSVYTHA